MSSLENHLVKDLTGHLLVQVIAEKERPVPWIFQPFQRVIRGGTSGNWLRPLERWLSQTSPEAAGAIVDWIARMHLVHFLEEAVPLLWNLEKLPEGSLRKAWFDGAASIAGNHTSDFRRGLPQWLGLEISASCNLECVFCSVRGGYQSAKTMPLPRFISVVDMLAPYAQWVRINGQGEATIVPNILDYARQLARYHTHKEIITNIMGPDEDVYLQLWDMGFLILVSWDGVNPQTFERLRKGARYDIGVERLKKLAKKASEQKARERLLLINTLQPDNLEQLPDLTTFAADIGAGGVLINMIKSQSSALWQTQQFAKIVRIFEEAQNSANQTGIRLVLPNILGNKHISLSSAVKTNATGCSSWSQEIMLRYDLSVTPCNMLNPYLYGWLSDSVERVLHSPSAKLFVHMMKTQQRHPYCQDCAFLQCSKDIDTVL